MSRFKVFCSVVLLALFFATGCGGNANATGATTVNVPPRTQPTWQVSAGFGASNEF